MHFSNRQYDCLFSSFQMYQSASIISPWPCRFPGQELLCSGRCQHMDGSTTPRGDISLTKQLVISAAAISVHVKTCSQIKYVRNLLISNSALQKCRLGYVSTTCAHLEKKMFSILFCTTSKAQSS